MGTPAVGIEVDRQPWVESEAYIVVLLGIFLEKIACRQQLGQLSLALGHKQLCERCPKMVSLEITLESSSCTLELHCKLVIYMMLALE